MALYGSSAGVKDLLNPSGNDEFSNGEESRIATLLETVSGLIESRTGAVFGAETPETVAVEGEGGNRLFLPKGIRSLTSIVEGPDWSSGAWVNGVALTTSAYRLESQVANGAYRTLVRMDGAWSGQYVITGVWEDRVADVPEDIHYLANYLTSEIYKKQQASPAGFVGPDGAAVPVRNTFNEPEVRAIIDRYRVGPSMWVIA